MFFYIHGLEIEPDTIFKEFEYLPLVLYHVVIVYYYETHLGIFLSKEKSFKCLIANIIIDYGVDNVFQVKL